MIYFVKLKIFLLKNKFFYKFHATIARLRSRAPNRDVFPWIGDTVSRLFS